jgi:hypothetical protein
MNASKLALALAIALTACDGADYPDEPRANASAPPIDPQAQKAPTCHEKQKSYLGFGGNTLESTRLEAQPQVDRGRVKPFSSLAGEYARVLGFAPDSLAASAATFREAPERWYVEPTSNAVAVYQSFSLAFEGCARLLKPWAKYEDAPTEETARAECADWQRRFWSRTPTPIEIDACVALAVNDSATEPLQPGGPKPTIPLRRWTYACASVLTSAGFTTY